MLSKEKWIVLLLISGLISLYRAKKKRISLQEFLQDSERRKKKNLIHWLWWWWCRLDSGSIPPMKSLLNFFLGNFQGRKCSFMAISLWKEIYMNLIPIIFNVCWDLFFLLSHLHIIKFCFILFIFGLCNSIAA